MVFLARPVSKKSIGRIWPLWHLTMCSDLPGRYRINSADAQRLIEVEATNYSGNVLTED